ncbi:MAG TPA: DUF2332 domain-containing protein [Solirubrobacteraceae bacterium]|nr:DUF2332 domain-containing protein [Solirubrobacteraceae bacterium]
MASSAESFARRFRRHAAWLVQSGRSPLHAAILDGAADDIDAGGSVRELVAGVDAPPGSVPQIRLLSALHELVLAGRAPALAEFYPSAGGSRSPQNVWPAAAGAIDQHFDWLRERVKLTVQTNEPGRSAVLYLALLWLTHVHRKPIRLLEIGASAGVNLLCDRFCYLEDGRPFGDPESPVRFEQPWVPGPPIDLAAAEDQLELVARAGCDLAPLDPARAEDRLRLLSYMWPDEQWRVERARLALELAGRSPMPVARERASSWLAAQLAHAADGALTVVWHSVVRQYAPDAEWAAVEAAVRDAAGPTVELSMEPTDTAGRRCELIVRGGATDESLRLAWCDDHGPPVVWVAN